jgi:hypothetical protein
MNISTAIASYIPPIWQWFDTDYDELPEIVEGDLVEFTDHYDQYDGCGIIHYFTRAEFKNLETGEFEMRPCAVIVSANPDTDWHDFVPLENIDPLSLSDYINIYESEYGHIVSEVSRLHLRIAVATKMSAYSRLSGNRHMSPVPSENSIISFQGGVQ